MKNACKVLIVLVLASCSNKSNRLEQALLLAGKNRPEIERVLTHYSSNPADSLKYKAAVFLIENMPGHYSYEQEKISEFYKEALLIIKRNRKFKETQEALSKLSEQFLPVDSIEDIQIITADFLFENIEHAFNMWQKPWAYHLSFEQFCECLLPYKCVELQELDAWKKTFCDKFLGNLRFMPPNDELNHFTQHVAMEINKDLYLDRKIKRSFNLVKDYFGIHLRNAETIHLVPFGTCMDYSILATTVMRSNGVPAVLEYVPLWGKSSNGHEWHSILANNGKYQSFIWNLESSPGDFLLKSRQMYKVLRYTYAANPMMEEYLYKAKYSMPHITKFQEDVTSNYVIVDDLTIPIKPSIKLADKKYVHLGVFDNAEWRPIDFGWLNKGKAVFKNVGRDAAYIVLGYDGEKLVPISDPFILKATGERKYCIANITNNKQISLTRKYPKELNTAIMEQKMVGGQIQASNDKNFVDYKIICSIDSAFYPIPMFTEELVPYRYWRYISTNKRSDCNFAELQFFASDNTYPLKGDIICSEDPNNPINIDNIQKGIDGDWLTNLSLPVGGWIGFDFGKPIVVNSVACVPRSDDNAIHLGDLYELKYWQNDKWVSIEIQEALKETLHFENVPDNALLLLTNTNRGKQQRIFTYENGKQLWW